MGLKILIWMVKVEKFVERKNERTILDI